MLHVTVLGITVKVRYHGARIAGIARHNLPSATSDKGHHVEFTVEYSQEVRSCGS